MSVSSQTYKFKKMIALIIITLFLAYSNGANDNFKGVATIFGSKLVSYNNAILITTTFTFAGVVVSAFFAESLVKSFSGKGLIPDAIISQSNFIMAVALGCGLTVILATKLGFPISTTHGLVGALVGAGFVGVGKDVDLSKLGKTFLLPLLFSPILSAFLSYFLFLLSHQILAKKQKLVDSLHYITAAIVCFARGLNDGPKIAGMLLIINFLDLRISLLLIAISMCLGGWFNSKKIAETMSQKLTIMNGTEAFNANFVTSILVISASLFGLPVSTTHVSVGSLAGIGFVTKKLDTKILKNIILSWVLTLPISAAFSAFLYLIIK